MSTLDSGMVTPPELSGWKHVYSGKVRDLYSPTSGDAERVLVVTSDRMSAFDYVLSTPIPGRGIILTQLSLWWFQQLRENGIDLPHHILGSTAAEGVPQQVVGRATICQKLSMFPVECIARGYLTGSGLKEYQATGTVCAQPLPSGLEDGSKLPEAIYTPSSKAEVGAHDENISFAATEELLGPLKAKQLAEATLQIYRTAEVIARRQGILLADTKLEFGADSQGRLTLGDEVLTPDSSRFWDAAQWQPGRSQASFDKQYVRDWLTSAEANWDRVSPPPALPPEVVAQTQQRYLEAYRLLTGEQLQLAGYLD